MLKEGELDSHPRYQHEDDSASEWSGHQEAFLHFESVTSNIHMDGSHYHDVVTNHPLNMNMSMNMGMNQIAMNMGINPHNLGGNIVMNNHMIQNMNSHSLHLHNIHQNQMHHLQGLNIHDMNSHSMIVHYEKPGKKKTRREDISDQQIDVHLSSSMPYPNMNSNNLASSQLKKKRVSPPNPRYGKVLAFDLF